MFPTPESSADEIASTPTRAVHPPGLALALVVIDMQRDFLLPGGFGETLGNDVWPAAEGR